KEIYDVFKGSSDYEHFRHVSTFGGNPAACAVALENLEIYERENLIESSREKGDLLREKLAPLYEHPYVGDNRGKGLLVGIELVIDRKTKEPVDVLVVNSIIKKCREAGVIIGKNGDAVAGFNNILAIGPPL